MPPVIPVDSSLPPESDSLWSTTEWDWFLCQQWFSRGAGKAVCVCVCVRACVRACVCACVRAWFWQYNLPCCSHRLKSRAFLWLAEFSDLNRYELESPVTFVFIDRLDFHPHPLTRNLQGPGIAGAQVHLDGGLIAESQEDGLYQLFNITTGSYIIQVGRSPRQFCNCVKLHGVSRQRIVCAESNFPRYNDRL